ncbi:hypothetical protein GBA52_022795 [Prunus armeniaca]|nr:hypothetical protein GBA52_022795 [Prunus armeniaca]
MHVAIEAGSASSGASSSSSPSPLIIISYFFFSEALGIQILIFISFSGLKIRDIELASRAVLCCGREGGEFRGVRQVQEEGGGDCESDGDGGGRFVKDFLGGDKVLGTEIEVNPKDEEGNRGS